MKTLTQGRLLMAAVVVTTAALIAFAVVQYRSSREVRQATGVRLADTLQMSLVNWHVHLERNFTDITRTLDLRAPGAALPAAMADALADWRTSARYPTLVDGLFVHEPGAAGRPDLTFRLSDTGTLNPHATLPVTPGHFAQTGWTFDPKLPALVRPLAAEPARWLIVILNRTVLREAVLPELALRYFSGTDGLDYEVALFTERPPALYASDAPFGRTQATDADGVLNVFGRRSSPQSRSALQVFHTVAPTTEVSSAAVTWFALPTGLDEASDWRLFVRHRSGGALGAFLVNTQRRDLVATLGSLALLVASITLLLVASHRAQRLAQLQMSFVTTVSHELRTPLAVIGSAADNIARGIVREPDHLSAYGGMIGQHARQLSALVERILLFASQTAAGAPPVLTTIAVGDAVESMLASVNGLTEGAGFTVETVIEPDLPAARGDATAFAHCLENLLTNAVKYSGSSRWLSVHAAAIRTADGRREVQVSVSDRGIGISPAELKRIFEPFYRSPSVIAAQIHGTGLGLALARSLAERMGGRISVSSEEGRGSRFTLHLPDVVPDRT